MLKLAIILILDAQILIAVWQSDHILMIVNLGPQVLVVVLQNFETTNIHSLTAFNFLAAFVCLRFVVCSLSHFFRALFFKWLKHNGGLPCEKPSGSSGTPMRSKGLQI